MIYINSILTLFCAILDLYSIDQVEFVCQASSFLFLDLVLGFLSYPSLSSASFLTAVKLIIHASSHFHVMAHVSPKHSGLSWSRVFHVIVKAVMTCTSLNSYCHSHNSPLLKYLSASSNCLHLDKALPLFIDADVGFFFELKRKNTKS